MVIKQKKRNVIGTFEVARRCHVTPATITNWIKEGRLKPSFKTAGGQVRFFEEDFIKFLKSLDIPVDVDVYSNNVVKILIVDDDPTVRRLVNRLVSKIIPKSKVYEATNGYEAGYKTKELKPTLVILDLKLPGVNGFDVCRTIKKDNYLSETKVLATTGYDKEKSKQIVLKAGADAFLQKPFDNDDFARVLKSLLTPSR